MTGIALIALLLADEPRLRVTGDVQAKRSYTAMELRTAFASSTREVAFTEQGVAGQARAFPLVELLKTAGVRLDPKRKNAEYSVAVVALGPDGYSAVFSGAELSPGLGRGDVWAAIDWNGKDLDGDDAPIRLLVPSDAKPSRWVHGVRTLRIVNLAPKGHGPQVRG